MALICCTECGKAVSDKAEMCPHCGISFKKEKSDRNKECLIAGIVSFPLGVFLLACNVYWTMYAFFLILLGITDIIFHRNKTYLAVAGMLYITGGLLSIITIPVVSGRYFILALFVIYAIIFLRRAFNGKNK